MKWGSIKLYVGYGFIRYQLFKFEFPGVWYLKVYSTLAVVILSFKIYHICID